MKKRFLAMAFSALVASSAHASNVNTKASLNEGTKKIIEFANNVMYRGKPFMIDEAVIVDAKDLEDSQKLKGGKWKALFMVAHFVNRSNGKHYANEPVTFFVSGDYITDRLYGLKNWKKYTASEKPTLPEEIYDEDHLVFGDKNATNKVVIFSDPLCPFCRETMEKLYKLNKEHPGEMAVYNYFYPIESVHPASKWVEAAALVLKESGDKEWYMKAYRLKTKPRGSAESVRRDMNIFADSKISLGQMTSESISAKIKRDKLSALRCFVTEVPTLYINGEIAETNKKIDYFLESISKKKKKVLKEDY